MEFSRVLFRSTSAGANALTLVAGDTGGAGVTTGGDVSVTGVVGSTRLGALTISSADDVIVSAGVTADSITSTSKSFSATTLTTSVANANGGAVDINAGNTGRAHVRTRVTSGPRIPSAA